MAMNTQTIYRVVHEHTNTLFKKLQYSKSVADTVRDWTPISADKVASDSPYALINLLAHLQDEMRQTANKNAGRANIQKSMQAIIKNAQKVTSNKTLHDYYEIDGEVYACDSYRIIHSYESFEIGKPSEGFKQSQEIINDAKAKATEELKLPTVGDLKSFIALKRMESSKDIIYNFGEDKPSANAVYLLDMITAFKNTKAYYNGSLLPTVIYFAGDDGEGVLMTIKKR